MKTTIEIDINDYITEEEKKEIAIQTFANQVKKELFKSSEGTIQSDSEIQRIIGNISYEIVMQQVQKHIPDCEKMIKEKTIETLNKADFSYHLFKKKDAWDREESLAIVYMNEAIKQSKDIFQNRIKETIANYDLTDEISEKIGDEFNQMAETIYKLSDLFHNKISKS